MQQEICTKNKLQGVYGLEENNLQNISQILSQKSVGWSDRYETAKFSDEFINDSSHESNDLILSISPKIRLFANS